MTFKKLLVTLGAFVLAFNLTWVVHGYGHALNLAPTGGKVRHITASGLAGMPIGVNSFP